MMRSGNPALRGETFTGIRTYDAGKAMTIQGTVNKTFILLGLTVFCAMLVWRNAAGFTPLLSASAGTAGRDAVELLHSSGADIHDRTLGGDSALMYAARAGKPDVVSYLLEAGASIGARNDAGWTAMLNATESGDTTVVAGLLEHGADPNEIHRGAGRTALHAAAEMRYNGDSTAFVTMLLEAGADPTIVDRSGMTASDIARQGLDKQAKDVSPDERWHKNFAGVLEVLRVVPQSS